MGLISEETIQRVTESTDIVDLVGSYFPLKRAGTNFVALCPFHREKSPSFHVTPSRQTFHCFGCGAGGGAIRFVMDYEHVDFPSAVKRLAQRAGIPVIEEAGGGEDDRNRSLRQRLLALHAEAADWFHRNLLKAPEAEAARRYLKSRGIGSEIAKSWQLGYAPDSWDALLSHLRTAKFTGEEIAQSGLASAKDGEGREGSSSLYSRFRDRVMFPIRNDYGEVIAFSGRVLDPDAKTAKYVNSPETPLFTKGKVLYGLDKTKRDLIEKKTAIVCEGQLDLISAYEAGVRHVIAPQGTAFTSDQARLLRRYVETVLLCFDSDTAGQKAATRSLPALLSNGLEVKMVVLPKGDDPDSLIRRDGADAFLDAVHKAQDFFSFWIEAARTSGLLSSPQRAASFINEIGSYVSLILEKPLREAIIGKLHSSLSAASIGIPTDTILKSLKSPKPLPEPDQGDATATVRREKIELSAGLQILCQLALTSRDVRLWLREQSPAVTFEPGGALLDKVTRADFEDSPAGTSAFLSTLDAASESTLTALLRPLADPLARAQEMWNGFLAQNMRQQIDGLKARLGQPDVTPEQVEKIQKQILDLKIRVADVFRLSSKSPKA